MPPEEELDYDPDESMGYTCTKCGCPICAAMADDNGGRCDECSDEDELE